MSSTPKFGRPTRLEGLTAFIAHYVEKHEEVLNALAEKVSMRLAAPHVNRPFARHEIFDLECRVRDGAERAYDRDFKLNLILDLQTALAAWVQEYFRVEGQPDVQCDVEVLHARFLKVVAGVDYLAARDPKA